jgi:hypothetical protein
MHAVADGHDIPWRKALDAAGVGSGLQVEPFQASTRASEPRGASTEATPTAKQLADDAHATPPLSSDSCGAVTLRTVQLLPSQTPAIGR